MTSSRCFLIGVLWQLITAEVLDITFPAQGFIFWWLLSSFFFHSLQTGRSVALLRLLCLQTFKTRSQRSFKSLTWPNNQLSFPSNNKHPPLKPTSSETSRGHLHKHHVQAQTRGEEERKEGWAQTMKEGGHNIFHIWRPFPFLIQLETINIKNQTAAWHKER